MKFTIVHLISKFYVLQIKIKLITNFLNFSWLKTNLIGSLFVYIFNLWFTRHLSQFIKHQLLFSLWYTIYTASLYLLRIYYGWWANIIALAKVNQAKVLLQRKGRFNWRDSLVSSSVCLRTLAKKEKKTTTKKKTYCR